MASETFREQRARLALMATDSDTWDLSDNDQSAIAAILQEFMRAEGIAKNYESAKAAAVAAEREACAKVAEDESHCHESARSGKACGCAWCACAVKLAAAIRARGGE